MGSELLILSNLVVGWKKKFFFHGLNVYWSRNMCSVWLVTSMLMLEDQPTLGALDVPLTLGEKSSLDIYLVTVGL